ncbi:hypothetical protein BH23PLA1_BH23PLA1_27590 [soil metagenome]
MSSPQAEDVAEVLDHISDWPARKRLSLARKILETLEKAP